MSEKLLQMAMLYDFYGALLTDRQRETLDLYYHNDWSLGEIAQQIGSSRQAVNDALRRAESALETFETKLGLVAQYKQQLSITTELLQLFNEIETVVSALMIAGAGNNDRQALLDLLDRLGHGRDLVQRLQ